MAKDGTRFGVFPAVNRAELGAHLEWEHGRMPFTLAQVQQLIRDTYDARDRQRGVAGTFLWFMEEVGELASAQRSGAHFWLFSTTHEYNERQQKCIEASD